MKPWVLLDCTPVPNNGGELCLYQRDKEFSIRIKGRTELMNTRLHGSEDALASLTCDKLQNKINPHILIGGLGMGFTLATALKHASKQTTITVAELVPAVIKWNKGPLGEHAGNPLKNTRVNVCEIDVAHLLEKANETYDAILLDVDNGPEGLTQQQNNWLYSIDGLTAAYAALKPQGILSVWSAGPEKSFTQRLKKVGFDVKEERVFAHGNKGTRHVIWFARRTV